MTNFKDSLLKSVQLKSRFRTFLQRIEACKTTLSPDKLPVKQLLKFKV